MMKDEGSSFGVFVYGTLKQGLRNHGVNKGVRRAGEFETLEALPLYIVGKHFLPWLLDLPGQGFCVRGELYDCTAAELAAMDKLERIGEPGWYLRRQIVLRPVLAAPDSAPLSVQAWVYFGSQSGFTGAACHAGPLREYTADLAQTYRPATGQ
jgi:gamma-glutamylaminecyclotransferase